MLKEMSQEKSKEWIRSALFGVAVGDALGVPVEFKSRDDIAQNPVTDMLGFGTYNLPPGTWSDDGSLTFCLAEALTRTFDLEVIGENFVKWYRSNFWTPRGIVFDIGISTRKAIQRLEKGKAAHLAGDVDVDSNGNGALMRVLPLLFYIQDKTPNERFELTKLVSSITHGHIRSTIACFYYLEFARHILAGKEKQVIYQKLQSEIPKYLTDFQIAPSEINVFNRLLRQQINILPVQEIQSSGYVLHTLEASIWCVLNTENYRDAVLKAVNLGIDTDTTAAVTGGLAGLLYGIENIPEKWLIQIARKPDIEDLCNRLFSQMNDSFDFSTHS
jgi:ADP-ribosyl-[dinitrogen reductase] hydrolase